MSQLMMRLALALSAALVLAPPVPRLASAKSMDAMKPMGAMHEWIEQGSLAPMLEKVLPAVVSIRTKGFDTLEQNPLFSHPLFGRMVRDEMGSASAMPEKRSFVSSGSGVIVDPARGLIITNFHVIERATEIKVRLTDGREFDGKLIGRDAATDVATVQIDASDLTGIPIGDSTKVRVGDFVVAIGNPLGLDSTATMGMVSSLMRSNVGWREFESYIQHDAAVNSGNSGGALVNMSGELIGINTAILSPSGGSVGLGFAIPIVMGQKIMEQLIKYGKVRRGTSGLRTADITPETTKEFNLTVRQGALIRRVQKGSPGDLAGLKVGDVITAIMGKPIRNSSQAATMEVIAEIGQTAPIEVNRSGKVLQVPVTIADLKPEPESLIVPSDIVRLAGLTIATLEEDSAYFGEVRGIQIADVKKGTFPELVGFLAGDIITAIDQDKVRKLEDVVRLTREKNTKFDVHVIRNGVPVVVRYPL